MSKSLHLSAGQREFSDVLKTKDLAVEAHRGFEIANYQSDLDDSGLLAHGTCLVLPDG